MTTDDLKRQFTSELHAHAATLTDEQVTTAREALDRVLTTVQLYKQHAQPHWLATWKLDFYEQKYLRGIDGQTQTLQHLYASAFAAARTAVNVV